MVLYKQREVLKIVDIHPDPSGTYYTLQRKDRSEVQTVKKHLEPSPDEETVVEPKTVFVSSSDEESDSRRTKKKKKKKRDKKSKKDHKKDSRKKKKKKKSKR
mmetsp:Transcript_13463/g.21291  ORF Transcript_13463/g.21291 Transcript_13463/m.21291 type:complete len:102 (-) Transcript_13463:109-414(-)